MINSLTPLQEKQLIEFREKWLKIGLCCDPADKPLAEKALTKIYKNFLNLDTPYFWWVDSPLMANLIIAILRKSSNGEVKENLRVNLQENLGENLWANLEANLRANLWENLRANLGENLVANLWENLGENLRANFWENLVANLRVNLRENLCEPTYWWGQQDASWIAFYLFPRYFLEGIDYGKDNNENLETWADYAKSCNWVWFFKDICFVSDRPTKIKKDNETRLHADGEMACEYRDGYGIYCYHGVNLPTKYGSAKQHDWKSEWILKEKNAELRRVLIQGIGYGKICRDLNAKLVDSWKEYELLRIDNADVEPIIMVKMVCPSTGLLHAHRVPPDMDTARNAIKWVNHGIDKEEFIVER